MLKPILLLLALACIQSMAFSQSIKTDSTQHAKNEFSFILGVGSGAFSPDYNRPTRIPQGIIGFEYARIIKKRHFIRLGHRVSLGALDNRKDPFSFVLFPTPGSGESQPQPATLKARTQYNFARFMSALYIGYNHMFTNRNHGLVLGADIHIGISELKASKSQLRYYETISFDASTGTNSYQYTFKSYGTAQKTAHHVFAGISPNIGYRYNANPYLSLGFNYTPLIGYTYQFKTSPNFFNNIPEPPISNSFWFFQNNLEIKLIFPLNHRKQINNNS